MIYYGNGKIEWEESIFLDEDGRHDAFFDMRYIVKTKDETIEIVNPTWTNIKSIFEDSDSRKTYIARFVLNNEERIDIFIENIICIRVRKLMKYEYCPIKKEIIATSIK
jgi:hypothetical protein